MVLFMFIDVVFFVFVSGKGILLDHCVIVYCRPHGSNRLENGECLNMFDLSKMFHTNF
jgi:hypothetical protein